MMSKNSSSLSSLNTQEALILGNPPDPSLSSSSNLSSSLSSTLSSALSSTHEIDSKKQSHQTKEQQRGRGEERELQFMGSWRLKVKSSSSIMKGRSAIKKRRKRSSIIKRLSNRKKKEMMDLDRDFELMPPPGSHKKNVLATVDVDKPFDPNEPYCICNQVALGDMIGCDNDDCQGGEWFHYSCVGLTPETSFKGKWYCPTCKLQNLQIATLYCEQGNCIGVRAARVQVNGTEEGEASS